MRNMALFQLKVYTAPTSKQKCLIKNQTSWKTVLNT